jgi:hypothetical protein
MWPNLITEIASRIQAARAFFTAVAGPPNAVPPAMPITVAAETAVKGLIFVQLYAIYEFAVCSAVRSVWLEINGYAAPLHSMRLEILGAALHPELTAVMDCRVDRGWETRMTLFRKVDAADPVFIADTFFPADGSHYRVKQLQTIWDLLGIAGHPLPRMPLIGLIDHELVEHRNAISHGRRTAEDVGRYYSVNDIHGKIDLTREVCLHIVTTMQAHCSNPANLAR